MMKTLHEFAIRRAQRLPCKLSTLVRLPKAVGVYEVPVLFQGEDDAALC